MEKDVRCNPQVFLSSSCCTVYLSLLFRCHLCVRVYPLKKSLSLIHTLQLKHTGPTVKPNSCERLLLANTAMSRRGSRSLSTNWSTDSRGPGSTSLAGWTQTQTQTHTRAQIWLRFMLKFRQKYSYEEKKKNLVIVFFVSLV